MPVSAHINYFEKTFSLQENEKHCTSMKNEEMLRPNNAMSMNLTDNGKSIIDGYEVYQNLPIYS